MATLAVTTTVPGVPVDPDLTRKLKTAASKEREWREQRDQLIYEAWNAGASLREIADLVRLSHVGVRKIVKKMIERPTSLAPNPLRDPRAQKLRERERKAKEFIKENPDAFPDVDDQGWPKS